MLDAEVRHQRYAMIAAVCATAVLGIALFNRVSQTGPCTYNSFQRSAVCTKLSALPSTIPANTQTLHCKNDDEVADSPLKVLNRFNFSMLRQLRELALVRCGIEELRTDTFSFVPQLRRLDLRHNHILHITGNQFRGISELEYLLLSDNPLVELGDEAFRGLTIGRLELVNNPSLQHIADTAFHSARLLTLVVFGSSLEKLTKAAMHHVAESLRDLVVSNNSRPLSLEADAFVGFRLRRLVLTNDQLTSAGFLAHGDHDEIVLDSNDQLWSTASSSPRSKVERKRTRRISLRNTSITALSRTVDFSAFADVEELNLSCNKLRAVTAGELRPFERLRVLNLSNNSIEQLVGNFTSVLLRLDTLDLRNNSLEVLPELTWRPLFERLRSAILFEGNRLHYNCEMRWLAEQENLLLSEDDDSSFQCVAPVIKNASVLVADDQVYVVCEAAGDPAPRVTWSTDGDRMLSRVEPSSTRRCDTFSTRCQLAVTRLANYTCTASNLLGQTSATVDLPDTLRTSPHAWQTMKRRTAQLDIISTPLGFTLTLASIALLAYLLKQY